MTHPAKGIVIGKFYPYHRGHKHLIKVAAAKCQQLTVLVCKQPGQWIPVEERINWIKETLPADNIDVVLFDQEAMGLPDDGADLWAQATIDFLGYAPDVVFSSEEYGKPWADAMDSDHVLVDQQREQVPISGTMIRDNPKEHWDYLEEGARGFFNKALATC